MPNASGFRTTVLTLWLRFVSLSIVGLVFALALLLGRTRVQGWTFYLSTSEVVFEVFVRLLLAALVGVALGTICTAIIAPFLWFFNSSQEKMLESCTRIGVVVVAFLDSRFALTTLIEWSNRGVRFTNALLVAHALFFAVGLLIPVVRREIIGSLDCFLGRSMAQGIVAGVIIVAIATAGMEFVLSWSARTVKASPPRHSKNNIVLITFDALSAEDMSLYGYKLPTTPNIDAIAEHATVFTNYYSTTTYTTPCIVTMLTGGYPSESHVFQLQGHTRSADSGRTLPRLLRESGYTTGGLFTNPFAHYGVSNPNSGFDVLAEPTFEGGWMQRLWDLTRPLHQNSGFGSRVGEYLDLEVAWRGLTRNPSPNLAMRVRPGDSFEQAQRVLAQLPDGFFLWVHLITPHHPYLPDQEDRGKFLPYEEGNRIDENSELQWRPHYDPDQQSQVDRRRLLYDEFVVSADRAFGTFIRKLEDSGRMGNTTVIISADHGESFEGGVFRHESPYLTRPTIHIPLIVKSPGQQQSRKIAYTSDQTSLPPTILDLAGHAKPDWMRGQSLARWLNSTSSGTGEGMAFSQFLEKNSSSGPLRHGMMAAIDGQYEYVFNLDTQKGALRPLSKAQIWDLDRTADNPAQAAAMRAAILARFPELNHESK